MNDVPAKTRLPLLIPGIFLAGLLLLSFMVLKEFLLTLIWAFIIAYVIWPLYRRLKLRLNNRPTASALLMTSIIATVIFLMVVWLVAMLQEEVGIAYQTLVGNAAQPTFQLPDAIKGIPGVGHYLQDWLARINNDHAGVSSQFVDWAKQWLGQTATFLGGVGHNVMKLGVILVTVFFCFRDGEAAIAQARLGLFHFLGKYQNVYLQAAGDTTRAVVYGLVLAALGQGLLAGIGYAVAGVKAPVLFGLITALLALIPMGATLVWLPIGITLTLTGQLWPGVGLLLWGVLAVSTVDNVIRPIIISGASRVPFLVVMFGVLGGLSAFGAVGLFLGPVILSVLLSVWQVWVKQQPAAVQEEPEGENIQQLWHNLSANQALQELATKPAYGLSLTEADERLQHYGANKLTEKPPRPAWHLLLAQFKGVLIAVLIIAAILAAFIGDIKDGIVILVVVVINALLGFYQEFQAEKSLSALKKMLTAKATVKRGNTTTEVPAEQLVPGDIVILEAGNKIPADGRIIIAHALEVDESSLTGESLPVAKQAEALTNKAAPLAERSNMLYMNNAVTRGRAEMLVTATGMSTEIGRLATLLAQEDEGDTPLQIQLDSLGKRMALIALAVVLVLFAAAILRGEPLIETTFTAIALAVAAIPEGLPAVVTVTLALGMHRMAKQQAIVKRLAAVETLGCTTVVCTDKTGTLTVNQMTARAMFYKGMNYQISGEGYGLSGEILPVASPKQPVDMSDVLLPLVLCNNSHLQANIVQGDPMENALLVLARKGGVHQEQEAVRLPRIAEIPFAAEHKFMATFHSLGDEVRVYVKGAPEVLLSLCQPDTDQATILMQNEQMANTGLRVLAVAATTLKQPLGLGWAQGDLMQHLNGLDFVALVGLMDPPRMEAREAIKLCQQAGIAVKMITGDQKITAVAIATELGLSGDVLEGTELATLDDAQLAARINSIGVFARIAPEQKVQIVKALKAVGHIVAMTGDGVNDAPALKSADIGIAMGITGTDVAKEAASMVLTDDNFATIVKAIKEGRGIYENMVKFIRFQLSTNIGAILTVAAAPLLGMPVPFTAVQLLWINIIMDGPPAMSLGVDPCHNGSMKLAPRNPDSRILSLRRFGNLFGNGLSMAIGTLGILYYGLQHGTPNFATTLAFNTFVLFQVANVFNARSEQGTAFNANFFTNKFLWLALFAVLALQILVIHWPPAQTLFHTTNLSPQDWLLASGVAVSVLVLEELRKLVFGRSGPAIT
ncbi:MAG: calcium-translocating P-type ATPase, PMCA-type [Methylococcales bacterium]|nr:calcium-translocating P-type ATPase, PMCA-type [Methylococcales bacterium]